MKHTIVDSIKKYILTFVFLYIISISGLEHILKISLDPGLDLVYIHFLVNTMALFVIFSLFVMLVQIFSTEPSTKESVMQVASVFWLLSLSPIITFLLGSSMWELNIMKSTEILEIFMFMGGINEGLIITYPVIIGLGIRSILRSEGHSIKKVFSAFFCSVSSFIAFLLIYSQTSLPFIDIAATENFSYFLNLNLLFLILLIQLIFMILLIAYKFNRNLLTAQIKNIKAFRSLHFVAMTVIGFVVLSQVDSYALDFFDLLNLPFFILAPFCMILTWQFTAMVNDIYDREIDRLVHPDRPLVKEKIDTKTYWNIAISFACGSLFISLIFGIPLLILNLTFMIAAMMYSIPPVRLKERLYGYVCVGYASVVAFLLGVYSRILWEVSIDKGMISAFWHIPIFKDVLSISLILFVVLSISPYINALADYEGDKESGVKSIYTIYGLEKGKKIVTVLIILLFLSPLSLLHQTLDFIMIGPASLIAAWVFYVYEDHRYIFMLYFMIIIYALLRYIEFI